MQDIASRIAASNVLRHELRHILLVSLFVITSLSSDWLFVIIITKEMLCIMWNSKHFWLQVNRTSSAYNLYRRNSMEDFAKSLKYVYLRIILWVPLFLDFFASHPICTTVAWVTSRWVKFVDVQFLTEIRIAYLQPSERSLKQTFLLTLPSSTAVWASSNQPDQSAPHLYAGTRIFGIFVPAAPTKRYYPRGSWRSHNSEP